MSENTCLKTLTIQVVIGNIQLTGSNSSDTDGVIVSQSWVQTGGSPTVTLVNDFNPFFAIPSVSADTVLTFTLTVADEDGATSTDEVAITITNAAPTAVAGDDQTVGLNSGIVLLNGSASSDTDGTVTGYSWSQTGTGPTVVITNSTSSIASFDVPTVTADTTLSFSLTVTDNNGGATGTDTILINIANTAPAANAGSDQTIVSCSPVNLVGVGDDSDGSISTYSWSEIPNSTVTLTNSTSSTSTFTAPIVNIGSADTVLTFRLTVTDDFGVTATDDIVVNVTAPVLDVTVSTADVKTVQFDWPTIPGATFYQLHVNADGASGFTLQTDNITATSTTLTLPVHLTDWVNAAYSVEAHDGSGVILSSPAFSITSEMINAIGYFKASSPGGSDQFGNHVSLSADGHTLAVGAHNEDSNAAGINGDDTDDTSSNSGAVYVFANDGSTWSQQAYLKSDNPDDLDVFGLSVNLSADGNTLAVGAYTEASNATGVNGDGTNNTQANSGAVYVFSRSITTWSQQAYLKASVAESGFLGRSISLSADGNTLAVGAENGGATYDGSVYIFTRSVTTWSQHSLLESADLVAFENDRFGNSVSLSADGLTLAVGAYTEDSSATGIDGDETLSSSTDSGAVFVYTLSSNVWNQQAYIKASNTDTNDYFGISVSISSDGNTLVVGANREDSGYADIISTVPGLSSVQGDDLTNGTDSGAAYVFTRSASTWSQHSYIKAADSYAGYGFGASTSISSDGLTLAVGAGNVYVSRVNLFTFNSGVWTLKATIEPEILGDNFGSSVSLSSDGTTMAVGARNEDGSATGINGTVDEALNNSGAVYLY